VVNSEEAAKLAEGNLPSFLRISKPEIELEPGIDLYDDRVYAKALSNFKRLCEQAPLKLDSEEHLYIYRLKMGNHVQTGILGAVSAEEYCKNIQARKDHARIKKTTVPAMS
jgi:uncharacterized protein (DUF1015 family)